MTANIWLFQVILALAPGVFSTELLPERYLKPQDFNHHPFTDVGIPASLKKALKPTSLYAALSRKRPREGREFPPQDVVIYPTPHPSVAPRKYLETNEIGQYDDPYVSVPKNYAFSYIVKDQHSGDDFSHSQAHNGKATRGQYRVKLPDGRTQIVSYTADHKGYRADVQYEEDAPPKPPPFALKPAHQLLYALTPSPTAPSPQHLPVKILPKPTPAPLQYQYVSTTPAPYLPQFPQQHYVQQQPLASTPLYPSYQPISSTLSPDHAVIVTPRPTYNRASEQQQSAPLYYRLL